MKEIQFDNLGPIGDLMIYFSIAGGAVLTLVIFFTTFFAYKYRRKDNRKTPEQIHGSHTFEFLMIGISLALVGTFFVLTVNAMNTIQDIPEHPEPDLVITGHQWWWEAEYRDSGVVTANEIHVPTGKKLLIQFNSDDVVHSWWVPRLGRKMDMVPGLDNYLTVTVKKAGEYWGSCSEFCGTQHGWMRIRLIAHSPNDFEKWQQEQLRPPVPLKDDRFESGQQLFASKTCVSCHAISPTASLPDIGPNLAHFASRKYFLSNIKFNDSQNLRAWLENPPKVKSGTKMPKLILTDNEIEALAYYLENLK